jgi:hypothetical protein
MKDKKGLDKDRIFNKLSKGNKLEESNLLSILLTIQQSSCLFFTIVTVIGGVEPDIKLFHLSQAQKNSSANYLLPQYQSLQSFHFSGYSSFRMFLLVVHTDKRKFGTRI